MQSNGAFAVKPAAAWLCGQPPSAERRSEIAPQVAEGYQSLYKFKAGSDGGYPYGALTSFGGSITLAALKGRSVVLYFYPKDNTSGCTRQAVDFTAAAKKFEKLGVSVLGVSKDSLESHEKFRKI